MQHSTLRKEELGWPGQSPDLNTSWNARVSQTPSPNIMLLTCWCSCVWMGADPASTFQHLAEILPLRVHSVREDHLRINSQAHMMVPLAILAQRLHQQKGGSVWDGGGDGECMSICVLSPVTSYKLPRIDSSVSYTNKYGTTQSVHTNTHTSVHPQPTPWVKSSFSDDL